MRFLCLVYFESETLTALSPAEKEKLNHDSLAYNDVLRAKNQYLAAEALHPVDRARTVRVRRGKNAVTGTCEKIDPRNFPSDPKCLRTLRTSFI